MDESETIGGHFHGFGLSSSSNLVFFSPEIFLLLLLPIGMHITETFTYYHTWTFSPSVTYVLFMLCSYIFEFDESR